MFCLMGSVHTDVIRIIDEYIRPPLCVVNNTLQFKVSLLLALGHLPVISCMVGTRCNSVQHAAKVTTRGLLGPCPGCPPLLTSVRQVCLLSHLQEIVHSLSSFMWDSSVFLHAATYSLSYLTVRHCMNILKLIFSVKRLLDCLQLEMIKNYTFITVFLYAS